MLNIVGTPIGNLDDLSYRQAKTIAEAEIILTEDTRSTGYLLKKITELFTFTLNPKQRLISYYKEKEFEKLPQVMEWLEDEKNIVLISQAGMPIISDPGHLLMKTVIKRDIPYSIIPGPSAVTTALLHSGYKASEWMFIGFLPKKESEVKHILKKCQETQSLFEDAVFIAFESPNRLPETLKILNEVYPESEVTVTRELTKMYEAAVRGTPSELLKYTYKGEITLVFHF